MSAQPPPVPGPPSLPAPGSLRCPRCSATIGPDQDWCLECGAPARTRLAQTPNWQLPTVAIGAIILLAGAMLAFAFVKLTDDDGGAPAGTIPATATAPPATAPIPPALVPTTPTTTPTTPTAAPTTTASTGTTPGQATGTTPTTTPTTPTTGATSTGAAPPPPLAPRTTP